LRPPAVLFEPDIAQGVQRARGLLLGPSGPDPMAASAAPEAVTGPAR
jgi:hypothetical protein